MGLLSSLLLAPVTGPLGAVLWVGEKIHEQARAEHTDPAAIKRALAALEARLLAGEITEDAFEELELELLHRLKAAQAETRG